MGRKLKAKSSGGMLVHWPVIVLGTAAIALVSGILYMVSRRQQGLGLKPQAVPVFYNRAEDATPFPVTLDPATFKRADVRQAYQTAKEIPGVLAQQPCYCYCQRKGQRSLLDCFKSDHAVSCNICIKESLLAGQMHREGKSPQEIRAAIIQGRWATVETSSQ